MIREFRTAVFFGRDFKDYEQTRNEFTSIDFLKVFRTRNKEELSQILKQSTKTAILLNDLTSINIISALNLIELKEAGVRVYFIDDGGRLGYKEIKSLAEQNVTTLQRVSFDQLQAKLLLFLMGKVELARYQEKNGEGLRVMEAPAPVDSTSSKEPIFKPAYFTHFRQVNGCWIESVSTHEQEVNIESLFSRSWTIYCFEILSRATEIMAREDDPNFSKDYYGIIFPHTVSSGRALSLIHLNKKHPGFKDYLVRTEEFLANITKA